MLSIEWANISRGALRASRGSIGRLTSVAQITQRHYDPGRLQSIAESGLNQQNCYNISLPPRSLHLLSSNATGREGGRRRRRLARPVLTPGRRPRRRPGVNTERGGGIRFTCQWQSANLFQQSIAPHPEAALQPMTRSS